jgi:hypothetical protein
MNLAQLAMLGNGGGFGGMGRRPMGGMRKPGMMDHGMGMPPAMGGAMPPPELPPREVPGMPPPELPPREVPGAEMGIKPKPAMMNPMGPPDYAGPNSGQSPMGGNDQLQSLLGGMGDFNSMAKPAMMGGNMMRQGRDTGGLDQILQMLRGRG